MADIQIKWDASAEYTITTASLATSATLIAGRESTAVDNTSDLALDYLVSGFFKVHSSAPTVGKSILVYAYGSLNDTPLYPDVLDGTDSDETFTLEQLNTACQLLHTITVSATVSLTYYFGPVGLAQVFGGFVPKYHGLFITQNTGQILSATEADCKLYYTPVYGQTVG